MEAISACPLFPCALKTAVMHGDTAVTTGENNAEHCFTVFRKGNCEAMFMKT